MGHEIICKDSKFKIQYRRGIINNNLLPKLSYASDFVWQKNHLASPGKKFPCSSDKSEIIEGQRKNDKEIAKELDILTPWK